MRDLLQEIKNIPTQNTINKPTTTTSRRRSSEKKSNSLEQFFLQVEDIKDDLRVIESSASSIESYYEAMITSQEIVKNNIGSIVEQTNLKVLKTKRLLSGYCYHSYSCFYFNLLLLFYD